MIIRFSVVYTFTLVHFYLEITLSFFIVFCTQFFSFHYGHLMANIGNHHNINGKCQRVGAIWKEGFVGNALEVEGVSNRGMSLKRDTQGAMFTGVSGYVPTGGVQGQEVKFWRESIRSFSPEVRNSNSSHVSK